jgi:uncharacterized protein
VKFLIWAVLIFFAAMMLRKLLAAASRGPAAGRNSANPSKLGEPMLRCESCGTHFPASEALYNLAGAAYCCEPHRAGDA